jgi:hypothetical protein
VNNKAYQGTDSNQPPGALSIGVELNSGQLDGIAYSDAVRASFGALDSEFHRFRFKIFQPVGTISRIDIMHEGFGMGDVDKTPGLDLFIWNFMTSSWEFLDEHDIGDTDAITTATITQDFDKYIDANGFLHLLVQAKENAGSCPFLYTYTGEKYAFIADLYGNGILDVPYYYPNPEDYTKIEGDLLKQASGFYKMQITQEYDEISYLDQMTLMTVDHSKDLDVFLSLLKEEIGEIYTVKKDLDIPVSAIDEEGKDVLPVIAEKDGIYTSGKQYNLDILELNLGDLSDAEEIKLAISAHMTWIPGSATSDTRKSYERFIQVKDENGDWVNILDTSEIIVPAAMPRTYVLDLTGRFIADDYSIKIGYYHDVNFDYVGIDTSTQEEAIINTLKATYADLHFRGYSNLKGVPAMPDYYDLSLTSPASFSQPSGSFTRFGNVLPLLSEQDDKFVILHHGDEISVNFDYIPAQEGMERDYVLYSWGYYKNKYYGAGGAVDPLPFNGMSSYPYPTNENYPNDNEHTAYLNEYNTRVYPGSNSNLESKEHYTIYTNYVKVEVNSPPVGGIVMPINVVKVLMPYLILAGFIAAVSTVYAIKKRKN